MKRRGSSAALAGVAMAVALTASALASAAAVQTDAPGVPAPAASQASAAAAAIEAAASGPAAAASAPAAAASAPAAAAAAPAAAPLPTLLLRPPATPELQWRGMLPTEGGAVGSGVPITYPAAGAAGLLAAVLTHAAINEGVKSAEHRRAQAEADQVLEPYRAALDTWKAGELWRAVQSQTLADIAWVTADPMPGPPDALSVRLVPSFVLSQDESVLIVDVALRFEGGPKAAPAERQVRVVSSPVPSSGGRAHWLADDARGLKQAAASMVAHAVQLAYQQLRSPSPEVPARTHRYPRGQAMGMERGHLLHSDCHRLVMRTLRGHLLSVPRAQTAPPCAQPPGF